MADAYLIDGVRSPIGSLGGSLSPVRADDLAAHVIRKLLERHPKLEPEGIADVVFGSRLSGGRPQRAYLFWHLVGNRFLSLLTNLLFNTTLADMETGTAAARELLYKACALADRNDPQLAKYSSMAKLFASDNAMRVTVEAIQVLGGYGYVGEFVVERLRRDAKLLEIGGGTIEAHQKNMTKDLSRAADLLLR